MAIFVVLATIAGVVIVALTSSSGDSFEDAGRSDVGEAGTSSGFTDGGRRPNEIRDPALESMGLRGVIQDLPPALQGHWHGKQSKNIGYRPYCPPWEYMTKGPNNQGEYEYDPTAADNATIGGPEGAGGVYSSNIGCFAPCYWSFPDTSVRPKPHEVSNSNIYLRYFDDNRFPVARQIRVGVNYFRANASYISSKLPGLSDKNAWDSTDINPPNRTRDLSRDSKPYFLYRKKPDHGNSVFDGRRIPLELLARGIPTVFIPNFLSINDDPAEASGDLKDRNVNNSPPDNKDTDNDGNWADENWEWRADPINRTCTIVNVTQNNRIVCSSEWQNCASRP